MKTMKMAMAAAVASMMVMGCNNAQSPESDLQKAVDEYSYIAGMEQGRGMKEYYIKKKDLDAKDRDKFLEGVRNGIKMAENKDEAYKEGQQFGLNVAGSAVLTTNWNLFREDSTKSISKELFFKGLMEGLEKEDIGYTPEEAQKMMEAKDSIIKAGIYHEAIVAGEKFLAENAQKEGVKVTESGLQYKVLVEGEGEVPEEDDRVKVKYVGKFIDGTEFDNCHDQEVMMKVKNNFPGIKEALMLMPVGSKWELYLPYRLGAGVNGTGGIKPCSTLIMVLELIAII